MKHRVHGANFAAVLLFCGDCRSYTAAISLL